MTQRQMMEMATVRTSLGRLLLKPTIALVAQGYAPIVA